MVNIGSIEDRGGRCQFSARSSAFREPRPSSFARPLHFAVFRLPAGSGKSLVTEILLHPDKSLHFSRILRPASQRTAANRFLESTPYTLLSDSIVSIKELISHCPFVSLIFFVFGGRPLEKVSVFNSTGLNLFF